MAIAGRAVEWLPPPYLPFLQFRLAGELNQNGISLGLVTEPGDMVAVRADASGAPGRRPTYARRAHASGFWRSTTTLPAGILRPREMGPLSHYAERFAERAAAISWSGYGMRGPLRGFPGFIAGPATRTGPKGNPVDFPRILSRRQTPISRWVDVVEKTVQFGPEREPETYHCFTQAPYVGVFVQTADRLIPIVRQYRPAVEEHTWELPAGTLDPGDSPQEAARREVLEETGLTVTELLYLGSFHPDTGRAQVDSHAFFARAPAPSGPVKGEEGVSVRYVTHRELRRLIGAGQFRHQIHLGIYGTVRALEIDLD